MSAEQREGGSPPPADPPPAPPKRDADLPPPPAKKEGEPAYKQWTTIAATAIAGLSLAINITQAIFNASLSSAKADADQKLAERTAQLQQLQLKSNELELKIKQRQVSPDLEARYLVVSGVALANLEGKLQGSSEKPAAIVQNKVWRDIEERWMGGWDSGAEILVETSGGKFSHGVLALRVTNRGKETAQKVVMTLGAKDFPQDGGSEAPLWELDHQDWSKSETRLADLLPGQSVVVPLGHMIGTHTFLGQMLMPRGLRWFNPTTQEQQSSEVGPVAPEDQWMVDGLDVLIAQ